MHVHNDKTGGILGEDVHAVDLRHRMPERHVLAPRWSRLRDLRICRPFGARRAKQGAVERFGLVHFGGKTGLPAAHGVGHCGIRRASGGDRLHPRNGGGRVHLVWRAPDVFANRARDELVHGMGIAKPHFRLARMDVDIHQVWRQFHEQHHRGMAIAMQHVGIRRPHGMRHQLVAHEAAVDEHELLVTRRAGVTWKRCPAANGELRRFRCDLDSGPGKGLAEQGPCARQAILRFHVKDAPSVVDERERHVGRGQRNAMHDILAMPEFGGFGLEEFPPRRCVEEQFFRCDDGPFGECRRFGGADHCARHLNATGVGFVPAARQQGQARNRGKASQRFPPKAERHYASKVFGLRNLAGRMARDRQGQFRKRDAGAVVSHFEALDAAGGEFDLDACRAGIKAVFQELLQCGGRAFDHFARRDLVDQQIRQSLDGRQAGAFHFGNHAKVRKT